MDRQTVVETRATNGGALAALLAGGLGCAAMGIMYAAATAQPAVGRMLTWYKPAGALSGMGGVTVAIWLAAWAVLHRRWAGRTIAVRPVAATAIGLLLLGFLLTFPPVARVF